MIDRPFETNFRHRRLFKLGQTARKTQYNTFFVCRSLGGNDRNDKQKTRVKSSEKQWNSEQKQSPSLDCETFLKPSFFDGFPLYRAVKALHLQAIMTSRNKVVWLGVTVRLLIAQWCNIKKSSVFLILNMHIIRSSWQMLYFQCLIIRFYRFSLILPKRKKNYMSPHFMPLSVWNSWPWLESSHKTSLYWSYVSLNFQWNKGFYFQIMITKWMQSIPLLQLFQVGVSKVTLKNILRLFKWAPWVI